MNNQNYPQGYWTSVFEQATRLTRLGLAESAEAAYYMARRTIDHHLGSPLIGPFPNEPKGALTPLYQEELALAS
jgi:hypothetical protein